MALGASRLTRARMLFCIGATEDAASGRAARPSGTDCISPNPLDLGKEVLDPPGAADVSLLLAQLERPLEHALRLVEPPDRPVDLCGAEGGKAQVEQTLASL